MIAYDGSACWLKEKITKEKIIKRTRKEWNITGMKKWLFIFLREMVFKNYIKDTFSWPLKTKKIIWPALHLFCFFLGIHSAFAIFNSQSRCKWAIIVQPILASKHNGTFWYTLCRMILSIFLQVYKNHRCMQTSCCLLNKWEIIHENVKEYIFI